MVCYHRYRKAKIDCLRFVMCPLLAQLEIGFFSSFSVAAVYSTNEANKAGVKQSIIFRCLCMLQISESRMLVIPGCSNGRLARKSLLMSMTSLANESSRER